MRLFFNRFIWVCFAVIVLLGSCVSTGKISVQVQVPAKRSIPTDIQSIVLMNRSMTSGFSDYNPDSLEVLFIKKKLHLDQTFLDSAATDTTIKAMANLMYESGRFDAVVPLKRNIPNFNASYEDSSPSLTLSQVKQICSEFKTDALLSLENFSEKIKTSYKVGYGNGYNGINLKEFEAYVQVAFHSNWKLYQPKEKLLIAKFEVNDTIFWARNGLSLQETYEQLPTLKEALMEGAVENAKNFSEYITPDWRSEERRYFITNNPEIDKAIAFLQKNDWKEAEKIWMKYDKVSSPTIRSMIEYNLALASEMNGDLAGAIEWVQKSFHTKYSIAAEDYLRLLKAHLANN
ncbi:MAG: DUF6340 family protein [Prolixibacteraceae bacterium]